MKKVITYGTFDIFHQGHLNLLKNAKALGDYLIVGVTSDEYDRYRGKTDVRQGLMERLKNVWDTGLVDEIIVEEYEGQKISDIQKYDVDVFTLGSDWEGQFDYLKEYCEVVYLPRTEGISSTQLRHNDNNITIGIIGHQNPSEKFIAESKHVTNVTINGIYSDNRGKEERIAEEYGIKAYNSLQDLLAESEAVYISERLDKKYLIIKECLNQKRNVMCEGPMFKSMLEANECIDLAKKNNLALVSAVKTKFFPSFIHLLLLIKTGGIGEVKDIEVSVSENISTTQYAKLNKYEGSMFDQAGYIFLPIFELLGTEYDELTMYSNKHEDFDMFTKGIMKYKNALASFKTGRGVKTEGSLIITGTKGYIFVPAPWWKPDYFEIRYEDIRQNKKFFWQYEGEGFRYEIIDFLRLLANDIKYNENNQVLALTKILEQIDNNEIGTF